MCRHLYNWILADRKLAYEVDEVSIGYYQQAMGLPLLKRDKPWYKSVHSQVLQDVLKRVDRAYQNYFRRVKEASTTNPGFPKFKKRGSWDSITYPQYRATASEVITVPKIGKINLILHRSIPKDAKVKTLTITKDANKWFACFSFEQSLEIEPKQDLNLSAGIDLGLIDFYYTSEGKSKSAPRYLRKSEKNLKKYQRKLSKAKKRSARYFKILKIIKRLHFKVKSQRNNFLHQESKKLLDTYDYIFYENLKINNMSKRPKKIQDKAGMFLPNRASQKAGLNKSIHDAGWGMFINFLTYKAEALGKQAIAVNPRYTSQKCSSCGEIVKKSLSIRTHRCTCGLVLNRDLNAAINIKTLGLESLAAKAA